MKPSIGTQWVANPTRQRVAASRKRVLRGQAKERPSPVGGWDEVWLRSVDSECVCRVIELRNLTSLAGAGLRGPKGRQYRITVWLGVTVPPESESRARTHGVPQERERPCRRQPSVVLEAACEATSVLLGDRESERLVVPEKRGNSLPENPVEERRAPGLGTYGGKDAGAPDPRSHLNETA